VGCRKFPNGSIEPTVILNNFVPSTASNRATFALYGVDGGFDYANKRYPYTCNVCPETAVVWNASYSCP
jgi:hypothetical protein